jgi:hypothetical protein
MLVFTQLFVKKMESLMKKLISALCAIIVLFVTMTTQNAVAGEAYRATTGTRASSQSNMPNSLERTEGYGTYKGTTGVKASESSQYGTSTTYPATKGQRAVTSEIVGSSGEPVYGYAAE